MNEEKSITHNFKINIIRIQKAVFNKITYLSLKLNIY